MLEWPYYQKPNRGIVLPPIPYTKCRWWISSSGWGDAGSKKFLRLTISQTEKHILNLLSTPYPHTLGPLICSNLDQTKQPDYRRKGNGKMWGDNVTRFRQYRLGTCRYTWITFSVFRSLSFFLSFFLLSVVVIPLIANLKI